MVVRVLDELKPSRRVLASARVDNCPEFAGGMLDLWASYSGVTLDFSRPGKPMDNAFLESFNGRLRQECLDPHWFTCLDDIRRRVEDWRVKYNEDRPHSALDNLAPGEFAAKQSGKTQPNPPSKLA